PDRHSGWSKRTRRPMQRDTTAHLVIAHRGGRNERALRAVASRRPERVSALPARCDAADQDHAHSAAPFHLDRSSQMKNGPPSKAVTTPTGTSAGASATRATASHAARNAAPTKNE